MISFLVSDDSLQVNYTKKIYTLLPENIRNSHECYVVSSHPSSKHSIENIPHTTTPKIIFDYADEWHTLPSYYSRDDVVLILKEYSPMGKNYAKLIPLAVVFNYDDNPQKQKTVKEKNLLLFSSMWLTESGSRLPVQMVMRDYEKQDDCVIFWNDGFTKGLSREEYRKNLRDAVITICPDGYMSPEVAKLHEALVAGNIIIASKKPNYHYYEGNPFFIYEHPNEIPAMIEKIRNMTVEEKQEIVDKGNAFCANRYSPEYFASLITRRLI